MSWLPDKDPVCPLPSDGVELVIVPRAHDLGGFEVRRALPAQQRQLVGPFIFFDQMGPGEFLAGRGLDVRPHPHIGLATVTYLFDGSILHRDSLGSEQSIVPGDVNWMTAGHGIAHSERTDPTLRTHSNRLFGIQSWVALPQAAEETAPDFVHHPAATLPVLEDRGTRLRLIAGEGWGQRSPVAVHWPLFYADAEQAPGASVPLPGIRRARGLCRDGSRRGRRHELRARPDAAVSERRSGCAASRRGRRASASSGRRGDGWSALPVLEFRQLLAGADRTGEGGLARGALRHRARRRAGVHSPARRARDDPGRGSSVAFRALARSDPGCRVPLPHTLPWRKRAEIER